MKAAVLYEANEPLVIDELEQDAPKIGEVSIQMGAAGICASDHHVMTGIATNPMPIVLGHEGAGTVSEIGPGVTSVRPGDRCILSFVSNCGHCRNCRTGYPNLCETNQKTGPRMFDGTARLRKSGKDVFQMAKLGVFSETLVVPEQACHPIPAEVSMEIAALIGCSVTTGVGAVINNPAVKPGSTVAVFGCGGVGLNVIQGAKLMNARRIIAVDIFDHKLEFTYKFGATDVINSREKDPVKAIHELTGGGADIAVDSFGGDSTTAAAVKSLRETGTAILVGLAPEGATAPIDMVDLVRRQKTLVGSYYGSVSPHESFSRIVDFYLKGELDLESLVTRRYQLEQINEGFDALARGEDGRGVIVF